MAVIVYTEKKIYLSTNSGVTWAAYKDIGFIEPWNVLVSSSDGVKLAAGTYLSSYIYTSIDYGFTWTAQNQRDYWYSIAGSADLGKLIACGEHGVYTSVDSGVTWTMYSSPVSSGIGMAASADGNHFVVVDKGAKIFTSSVISGVVDENAHTIAITIPTGKVKTALVFDFATSGASVKIGSTVQVSGVTTNNFTSPVTYTVTAADGTTQDYIVTVNN